MQKYNHVPFGLRRHLITWKPTSFYSRVNTRDGLKFCELNTKWLLLPRWLASTPIQIHGVGGLTNTRNGENLSEKGKPFRHDKHSQRSCTGAAGTPTVSSPFNRERRAGFYELAVFRDASGEKSEVSTDLFSQYLENLVVGKSATHWCLPTSYLGQTNLVSGRR